MYTLIDLPASLLVRILSPASQALHQPNELQSASASLSFKSNALCNRADVAAAILASQPVERPFNRTAATDVSETFSEKSNEHLFKKQIEFRLPFDRPSGRTMHNMAACTLRKFHSPDRLWSDPSIRFQLDSASLILAQSLF